MPLFIFALERGASEEVVELFISGPEAVSDTLDFENLGLKPQKTITLLKAVKVRLFFQDWIVTTKGTDKIECIFYADPIGEERATS
jgi:hypothetical protein